jgi:hypothetical protein
MKDLFRRVVVCQGQRIINNVIIKKGRKNRGQFGKVGGWEDKERGRDNQNQTKKKLSANTATVISI